MAKNHLRSLSIAALLLAASSAWSDDKIPNNTIAVGSYWIFYNVHADNLAGPFVPANAGLDVKNVETPYFAYSRRLSTHFAVELTAGIPPLTKSIGKGPGELGSVPYNNQVISTARWLAPSLLLKYVFMDDGALFRPYVGVGVNYVDFYDRDSTAAGNAVAGGPTKIELSQSWGPAGTVGVLMALPHNFGLQLSVSESRVISHLTAITGDIDRTSTISFNPKALVFAGTYSF